MSRKLCIVDTETTSGRSCAVDECDREATGRGMCHAHYKRWLRNGDAGGPLHDAHGKWRPEICAIEGCDAPHLALGLCSRHWQQSRAAKKPPKSRIVWDGRCKRCDSEGPFYARDRTCKQCRKSDGEAWRAANLDRSRATAREAAIRGHRRRRAEVLAAYGHECACCGETEAAFLAVDHIDGGGNRRRRSLTASGSIAGSSNFYRWLKNSGFPAGFQILCHNCNFAKSHGGCPHFTARESA